MALDVDLYKSYIAQRHSIGPHSPYLYFFNDVRRKFRKLIFWLDGSPACILNAIYHRNA
jgi:hypothetical protein